MAGSFRVIATTLCVFAGLVMPAWAEQVKLVCTDTSSHYDNEKAAPPYRTHRVVVTVDLASSTLCRERECGPLEVDDARYFAKLDLLNDEYVSGEHVKATYLIDRVSGKFEFEILYPRTTLFVDGVCESLAQRF